METDMTIHNIRYYKVSGKAKQELLDWHNERVKQAKRNDKAVRKMFSDDARPCYHAESTCVSFVSFDENPDKAIWKEAKRSRGVFTPKKNKLGNEVREKLKELTIRSIKELCTLIGFDHFHGLRWITPGLNIRNGEVYVSLPDDVEPGRKGFRRISDVTFEKAMEGKKK